MFSIQLKQQHIGTPVMLFNLLMIQNDLTWKLYTANHSVSLESPALCQHPSYLTPNSALSLIELIDSSLLHDNFRRRKMCDHQA